MSSPDTSPNLSSIAVETRPESIESTVNVIVASPPTEFISENPLDQLFVDDCIAAEIFPAVIDSKKFTSGVWPEQITVQMLEQAYPNTASENIDFLVRDTQPNISELLGIAAQHAERILDSKHFQEFLRLETEAETAHPNDRDAQMAYVQEAAPKIIASLGYKMEVLTAKVGYPYTREELYQFIDDNVALIDDMILESLGKNRSPQEEQDLQKTGCGRLAIELLKRACAAVSIDSYAFTLNVDELHSLETTKKDALINSVKRVFNESLANTPPVKFITATYYWKSE